MKVEILYKEKDEDFKKSLKNIRKVIDEFSKKYSFKVLEIQLIRVEREEDVEKLRFKGHVSVKINGKDIEGIVGRNNFGERIYKIEGSHYSYVPEQIFKRAVEEYIQDSIEAQKLKGEEPNQIC